MRPLRLALPLCLVAAPAAERTRLRALGFIGVMPRGMHHQAHHLAIARGEGPHR